MAHSIIATVNLCFGILLMLGTILGPSAVARTVYGVIGILNLVAWWISR